MATARRPTNRSEQEKGGEDEEGSAHVSRLCPGSRLFLLIYLSPWHRNRSPRAPDAAKRNRLREP